MKGILHISDLHVSLYQTLKGEPRSDLESYLTTNKDVDSSLHYIKTFITKAKEIISQEGIDELILLITGDIADTGEKIEYQYATIFIKKIIEELNINPNNCIIIPGDHDVNRRSLEGYLIENPTNQSYLLNKIKFSFFKPFYDELTNKNFDYDKVIFDYLNIEDKILILAINSNFKVNEEGGNGYIEIEKFSEELSEIKKAFSYDIKIICCWHHNITANYDNKNNGQWEDVNRRHLLSELLHKDIKLVLTGNEHTSATKKVRIEIQTSDCGAFSSINYRANFKIYPITISNDTIKLKNIAQGLLKGTNDISYYWNILENNSSEQEEDFILYEKNIVKVEEVQDLPLASTNVSALPPERIVVLEKPKVVLYEDLDNSEKLYQLIKKKNLFHSGHFHWSETSRAHNWIDVSTLLQDKNDLLFVKNAVIDIINNYKLFEDCDLIIGLGYEGNLIASKASIKFDIQYSYLPYSYRYKDHHDFENKLNLENKEGKYKNILVITDVVNDGRTIRKLIGKREKEFFSQVDRVNVISLFYTGSIIPVTTNILNSENVENFDPETDEIVNNINFYPLRNLKVEKCPYGKGYEQDCIIYKDGLNCVNLFYEK